MRVVVNKFIQAHLDFGYSGDWTGKRMESRKQITMWKRNAHLLQLH